MKKNLILLSGVLAGILLLPPLRNFFVINWTLRPIYLLILSTALSFFFSPLVIRLATALGALDKPDKRKIHFHPTPLWGGLAIYASFAIVILYNFDFSLAQKGVAIGATMLVGIGLLDDKFGVSAKIRLLVQLTATTIAIICGARMTFLPNAWWGNALEIIFSVIWFVGITNAMNCLDGMDGLCAGLAAINAFFFGVTAIETHQSFFMFLSAALCGSCLGFLPFNFRKGKPALIFLGDTGSTFLGFTLAGIALMGNWAEDNFVALIVPIIILAIPIFDMSLTTFMRIKHKQVHSVSEWLHFTGKDHFHHRLADMGFGKRRTVYVIHLIAVCLGINGFILKETRIYDAGLLLTETVILFILIGFIMIFVKKQYDSWAKVVSELSMMTQKSSEVEK